MRRGLRWSTFVGAVLAWLAIAPAAPATAAEPLRGEWHLDESCGGASCLNADSSGNGLTGTQSGSPTVVPGVFGNALHFSSEADFVNMGNQPLLQPPTVTLLAWVRANSTPATVKDIASQGAGGSCAHASYALYTGGSSNSPGLRFYIWNGSQAFVTPPASNAMWDGAWHLVAGTYDGANVHLYVDGQEVGAGTPASGNIGYGLDVNNDFRIGSYGDAACTEDTGFPGDIDETRIYSRALTATELGLLFAPSAAPSPAPSPGPSPVFAKAVTVAAVSGKVFIKLPAKGQRFVRLTTGLQIPVGSLVDTSRGKVRLTSATSKGALQSGDFTAGVFQVLQARREKGLTELRLKGKSVGVCPRARSGAVAARSRRVLGRLRAKARGRFRTRGRYSAATVRGTQWATTDRCDGTLTHVTSGVVVVRDLRTRRNIVLRAGKSFLARAP
jgi:hypothetical protein